MKLEKKIRGLPASGMDSRIPGRASDCEQFDSNDIYI